MLLHLKHHISAHLCTYTCTPIVVHKKGVFRVPTTCLRKKNKWGENLSPRDRTNLRPRPEPLHGITYTRPYWKHEIKHSYMYIFYYYAWLCPCVRAFVRTCEKRKRKLHACTPGLPCTYEVHGHRSKYHVSV